MLRLLIRLGHFPRTPRLEIARLRSRRGSQTVEAPGRATEHEGVGDGLVKYPESRAADSVAAGGHRARCRLQDGIALGRARGKEQQKNGQSVKTHAFHRGACVFPVKSEIHHMLRGTQLEQTRTTEERGDFRAGRSKSVFAINLYYIYYIYRSCRKYNGRYR